MGDSAALNQKKRKIAIDPDQEDDDPARTITVKTANENLEKDDYKHEKDAKKDTKKTDSKHAEETKKSDKPIEKPKVQSDKNAVQEKKPEKSAQIAPKNGDKKDKPATQSKEGERKKSSEPPKKRKISSSSESDSDSDSDDSSSDDSDSSSNEDRKKKKKKPTPKREVKKDSKSKVEPNKIVKPKDTLVYEVLKRWWYCMEDWPPKDYDYAKLLNEKNLRKVDIKTWKIEPEEKNGLHKVFEVPSYPGLFKNSKGELFDLRPKESCPCYETLRVKPVLELLDMLVKAYTNQISALEKSEFCEPTLLQTLKKELYKTEKNVEANKIRK